MSEHSEHKQAPSLARRHLLRVAAATAGRVGALAALSSLPIVGSSRPAKATPTVPCFLRGTNILTSKGEAHVEDLVIGDLVVTVDGEAMPIRWVGRNLFKKTGTRAWPQNVQPIRVSRFAIDDETPHADLYLSPKHALYVDGVLIPVENLINGMSVRPATPEGMDVVEYFHIELETHEVIFAEGTPVETFLVTNDRERFANFVEYERLYGLEMAPAMA